MATSSLDLGRRPRAGLTAVRQSVGGRVRATPTVAQRDRRLMAWWTLTAPFWVFSDLPRPALLQRGTPLPPGGPAGEVVKRGLRSIARKAWLEWTLTVLCRAVVLTILIGAIWMAIEVLGGPAVDVDVLRWIGGALLVAGIAFAATLRPTDRAVAEMLDRSFDLRERLVTSLGNIGREVPDEGAFASMPYLQVADAANAVMAVKDDPALQIHLPIRELVLAILLSLILASLFFMRGGRDPIPDVERLPVPGFVPAAQRFLGQDQAAPLSNTDAQMALSEAEILEMAERSADAQRDLQTLANALRDHALTRSIATMLQQGDYGQAAQALRDLGPSLEASSESERSALADDLRSASAEMTSGGGRLASASSDAADGLEQGGEPASQGMAALGDAVESTALDVVAQETLDEALRSARSNSAASGSDGGESQPAGPQSQSLFEALPDRSGQAAGPSPSGSAGEPGSPERAGDSRDGDASDTMNADAETGDSGSGAGEHRSPFAPQAGIEDISGGDAGPIFEEPEMGTGRGDTQAGDTAAAGGSGAGLESQDTSRDGREGSSASSDVASTLPEASEADVTDAAFDVDGVEGEGVSSDPRQAITLTQSTDGAAVQVPGTSGRSSLGGGAGILVAGGDLEQGDVAVAGPDRNHVPHEYRAIVERYFSQER